MARTRTVDDQSRRQRLARIEALQAEGARLMSDAREETMKTRIRLATLDLDEAVRWLNQDDGDGRPNLLQIIDSTIDLATRDMAIVAKALDDLNLDGTA
jgi:hypothetical protein